MTLDDLEIELRKLPGVRAAGFSEREDVLLVQLHIGSDSTEPNLPLAATRIAYRHSERPVAVELVRWRAPGIAPVVPPTVTAPDARAPDARTPAAETASRPNGLAPEEQRVRLLAVLTFPDTDELEVHLTLDGRRTIGRAAASKGLVGAVEATVDALHAFSPELAYTPAWAQQVEAPDGPSFLVACELTGGGGSRHGIAVGSSAIEAAARATLHALNRSLELEGENGNQP